MTLRITDNINQRRDTATFQVRKVQSSDFVPQVNSEIIVTKDTERIYGGIITGVDLQAGSIDDILFSVTAIDFTYLLDRKLILERYEDTTVGAIITDLLSKYDDEGFTMANVVGDTPIGGISFNRVTISEALEKLAEVTGYSWYVDYHKDIHFFPKNEEPAPFNLTDTSANYLWKSLRVSNDISQLFNVVILEGGEQVSEARTETYIADGEQRQFPLAYKFATMPAVTVNGSPVTVGVDGLDKEESFDAFWSFQQKYIRFKDGTYPDAADEVAITGNPLLPIIGRLQDSASVEEFGIRELRIKDKAIKTKADMKLRALAELQKHKAGLVEASFRTYTPGLRSGQVINVNSPIRGVNEDFLIQRVTTTMRTPEDAEWYVELATLRSLGIVEFFLRQLRDDGATEDQIELLLEFRDFEDEAAAYDELTQPFTKTSPPYYIWPAEGDGSAPAARVGFFTIEAPE